MSDLQPLPPWKKNTPNGYKYKDEVAEGLILEQLCIIAARLNDLNLTIGDVGQTFIKYIEELINKIEQIG